MRRLAGRMAGRPCSCLSCVSCLVTCLSVASRRSSGSLLAPVLSVTVTTAWTKLINRSFTLSSARTSQTTSGLYFANSSSTRSLRRTRSFSSSMNDSSRLIVRTYRDDREWLFTFPLSSISRQCIVYGFPQYYR